MRKCSHVFGVRRGTLYDARRDRKFADSLLDDLHRAPTAAFGHSPSWPRRTRQGWPVGSCRLAARRSVSRLGWKDRREVARRAERILDIREFLAVGIVVGLVIARVGHNDKSRDARLKSPESSPGPASRGSWTGRVTNGDIHQRDLDSTDRRYNPILLAKEENGALQPRDIFEREPRDAAFAPILEKRFVTSLTTALRELGIERSVRNIHSECKTLSCETRIEVVKQDLMHVYDAINGVMFGEAQQPYRGYRSRSCVRNDRDDVQPAREGRRLRRQVFCRCDATLIGSREAKACRIVPPKDLPTTAASSSSSMRFQRRRCDRCLGALQARVIARQPRTGPMFQAPRASRARRRQVTPCSGATDWLHSQPLRHRRCGATRPE